MLDIIERMDIIRIATLEKRSGTLIEKWIEDWNDENEPIEIAKQTEIYIGEVDYNPVKWQCPNCKRWNYELLPSDPSGAIAVCNHCHDDGEF